MLSGKARQVLNDPRLIAERDAWFARLASHFDRNIRNQPFRLAGHVAGVNSGFLDTSPEKRMGESLETLAGMISDTGSPDDGRFRPRCVECPFYGVHFIDKIFGADVFWMDDNWHSRHLKTPVGALEFPDLENDKTWAMARRTAQAFVESGVQLPLFGMPTLSSALNIAVNLYGQEILTAMLEEPDAARHDLRVVNDLIMTLHKWYIANVPEANLQPVISWWRTQPPGHGQLCGCTTQLVSGEQYAEFIAPLDNALLGLYPRGGMIHLCGAHAQHAAVIRDMPNVRAVQVNDRAAHDLPVWYSTLRDDQMIYFEPCAKMPPERAFEITNGGDRLVITA